MKIKSLLLPTLFVTSSAFAVTPYVEGQLTYINIDDVDSKTYSGSVSGITYTGAKVEHDYDNDIAFGFEIGAKDFGIKGVRLGLSYTRAKFDLDSSDVSGTITDGTTTISGTTNVKSSTFKSVGLDFDNTAKLYMANLYYDFDLNEKVKPFVGVGAGWADIENIDGNEFTASVSAGAKYYFDKQIYLGGKASYTNINSPKDDLGLKYDDIELYSATVMLGYEF